MSGQVPSLPRALPAGTFVAGLLAGILLVGLALLVGMWALMGAGTMGGGMIGGGAGAAGPGLGVGLVALLLLAGLLVVAWSLRQRAKASPIPAGAHAPPPPLAAAGPVPSLPPAAPSARSSPAAPTSAAPASEIEAVALRMLDPDERLLYLEVKEKDGSALQKDVGHRDSFSRAKVTRLLDRLEAKGLVVREREGMTNRVRLVGAGRKAQ